MDQDPLGQQARWVKKVGDLELWSKQLADGGRAVALVNRNAAPASIQVDWKDIWISRCLNASCEIYGRKGRREREELVLSPGHRGWCRHGDSAALIGTTRLPLNAMLLRISTVPME